MFENMENLKITSSLHRTNKPCATIENRATHSFIIRTSGVLQYNFGGRIITVRPGEVIFIPKGSFYKYWTASETECIYTSINFLADIAEPKPTGYSLGDFAEAEYIARHFSDLWKFGTAAEKYHCISLFYNLVSYLCNLESVSYQDRTKFGMLEPAISYLKEHVYDCSLKADMLPRLCGISGTYFRKIFMSRFGTTPQNYIISKRISHAKSIFDSGDFDTVKEVALSVGYNDPLYFSKVFKKIYGMPPAALWPALSSR